MSNKERALAKITKVLELSDTDKLKSCVIVIRKVSLQIFTGRPTHW